MNKVLITIIAVVLVFVIFLTQCSSSGKKLNVEIMETTRSTVRFRPVCPECGHTGSSQTIILYDGENDVYEDTTVCSECYKIFNIGISKD